MRKLNTLLFSLLVVNALSAHDARIEHQRINRINQIGKLNALNSNLLKTQTNVSKQRLDSVYNLTGGLNPSSKSIFNYDYAGNLTTLYNYQWSGSSWIPVSKNEYAYDNQNRNTSVIYYNWESRRANSWDVSGKEGYIYNALGLKKTFISYNIMQTSPDGSTFSFLDSGTHFEYTYNSKNQLTNISQIVRGSKIDNEDFFYDIHGNDSLLIYSSKNSLTDIWNFQKSTYNNTYNGNTITTTLITTGRIDASTGWNPGYRMEFTYDTNGNCVSAIDYYWNPTTGAQSSLVRRSFLFDTNYTLSDVLNVPDMYFFPTVNKLKKSSSYSSRTGGSPTSVDNYYYSTVEINTAVQPVSSDKILLYPNPAKDFLQISGIENIKTIWITDLNGRLMLTKKLVTNDNIYVGNLAKGMYIVKIIAENKTVEQKIVKE
ncbi:MAG: T9SS type A sorting domain-containing protein [Paludibacter sp.]